MLWKSLDYGSLRRSNIVEEVNNEEAFGPHCQKNRQRKQFEERTSLGRKNNEH